MKYGVAAAFIAVFGLAQAEAQPAAPPSAQAAAAKPAKWDINAPPGAVVRQATINVDEGTWMNLDVSPDGKTIAFDLLGDIYILPSRAGRRPGSPRAWPMKRSRASRPTASASPSPPTAAAATTSG